MPANGIPHRHPPVPLIGLIADGTVRVASWPSSFSFQAETGADCRPQYCDSGLPTKAEGASEMRTVRALFERDFALVEEPALKLRCGIAVVLSWHFVLLLLEISPALTCFFLLTVEKLACWRATWFAPSSVTPTFQAWLSTSRIAVSPSACKDRDRLWVSSNLLCKS